MADEKLLGDQVEEVLKKAKVDKALKKITKRDCGCKKRKKFLNKMHKRMQKMRDKIIEQQLANQKRR